MNSRNREENAVMTKLSEDQLNNLSKEELVNMFLLMQENMSILQERLAVMNENTFGRKTESQDLPPKTLSKGLTYT